MPMLNTSIATKISEYYKHVFKPYFINQLKNSSRLDIMFDRYISNSVKAYIRETTRSGTTTIVSDSVAIPKKISNSCVNENKTQLLQLLAKKMVGDGYPVKYVVCTYDDRFLASTFMDV